MATVWMRSKLQKMKPKTEPRFAVRTLHEDGPGKFKPVRMPDPPKDRTPISFNPATVQRCDPATERAPRRTGMGDYQPIRACVVYNLDVQSTLIKKRG